MLIYTFDFFLFLSPPITDGDDEKRLVGGCDDCLAWCREGSYFSHSPSHTVPDSMAVVTPISVEEDDSVHEFEYDLVVIGGKYTLLISVRVRA